MAYKSYLTLSRLLVAAPRVPGEACDWGHGVCYWRGWYQNALGESPQATYTEAEP